MSKIVTKYFSRKIANAVQAELSSNTYYFALSKHTEWANENSPNTAVNTTEAINNFHKEMILGKRIHANDVSNLIDRHSWQSGTVYAQYDDQDVDLYDKEFYIVNGSEDIYKCLFNNNDAPSTTEPYHTDTAAHQLDDGYIWKYMYSISTTNNTTFSTSSFVPVDANASISAAAANGSIDVILINTVGSGYRGYVTGTIAEVFSNTLFRIDSTETLNPENFFYNTSSFYITEGSGIGQLTTISSYTVNTLGHYILTSTPIYDPVVPTVLDATSTFRIAPQILIQGDGTGATAVCTVNTISNSYFIETIDVLSSGSNYSYANVSVVANPSYGKDATLRAVIPPKGGHGFDVATELGCSHLGVSVFFNNTESSTISTDVPFRQAGILSYPYKYVTPTTYLTFNALTAVSNTDDTITISNANTSFLPGDKIRYIVDTGNTAISGLANGNYYYVKTSNTTAITLAETYEGAKINLTAGTSQTGHRLYTTNVYGANTFNALNKINISSTGGTFIRNEVVEGLTSGATATIAYSNSTVVQVGTISGTFAYSSNGYVSEVLYGRTSTATGTISSINNSDIQPFTSSVLYMDNVEAITRSNTDFEQAYLILTL